MVRIDVLTLFPAMLESFVQGSILGRAQHDQKVTIQLHDFRAFSPDKHLKVDDTPYGGGAGMVLRVEPIVYALRSIDGYDKAHKILLTPQGEPYHQPQAQRLAEHDHLILICGHYEGFDERIRHYIDQEISIGDYILTGGEAAAMIVIESVVRLIPGVLHNEDSAVEESFSDDLLEYPHYTKPIAFEGHEVPEVLRSGHHEKIRLWRLEQQLKRTEERRPDLHQKYRAKRR